MDKKNYTIKDIANLASVSRGTVDRVLNNRGKVSEKARKKIEEVLDKIDYTPNLIARSLKNHRTYTIAILIPDDASDLYWMQMNQGIAEASKEMESFGVRVDNYKLGVSKEEYYDSFQSVIENRPDALIIVPYYMNDCLDLYQELETNSIPYVLLNSPIESSAYSSFIGQDYYQSGRTAGFLMNMMTDSSTEDRRLLILNFDGKKENLTHVKEKEKGFIDYLKENDPKTTTDISNFDALNSKTLSEKLKFVHGVYITNSKTHLIAKFLKLHPRLKVIGYDLIPENIKLIQEGTIDILLNQNPKLQGNYGVSFLAEYLLYGRQMPKRKLLPIDILTKENIEGYL